MISGKTKSNPALFQAILENSGEAIVVFDTNGVLLEVFPGIEKVLGFTPVEAMKNNAFKVIHPDDEVNARKTLNDCLSSEGSVFENVFYRIMHKQGHWVWVSVTLSNYLHLPDIKGVVYKFRNVSKEQEIIKNQELLIRQLLEKNEFINSIINDLPTKRSVSGIYQTIADVFFLISVEPDGRYKYIFVNQAFLKTAGLREDLVTGKFVDELMPAISWEIVSSNYLKAIKTGGMVQWEETTENPGGIKTSLVSITPVTDADGRCYRLAGYGHDITENKKVELELKLSEEKYRNIFEYSPLPKWIYDLDQFRILDVNRAAVMQYGYSREEFLQMTLDDIRPKEELPTLRKVQKSIKNREGTIKFGLFKHQRKDRTILMVEVSGNQLHFQGKKCMMVVINDVTEREAALFELKQQKYRLETAQQIAKLGYWQLNKTDGSLIWSSEVYRIWGYKEELNPDFTFFFNTIHPDDRDNFMAAQILAEQGAQELDYEHRIMLPDGQIKWVHERAKLEITDNGHILAGTVQDITRQKLEEERLRLYESMVAHTTDAILITEAQPFDEPGPKIVYVNKAFTKMTGYTAAEIIGQTPRIMQGPKSDWQALKQFSDNIRNWKPCALETINYKKNGEEFWINFSVTPVADEKGSFTHWVAIEREITQNKNEQFQRALLSELRGLFALDLSLESVLCKVLEHIVAYGDFSIAQIWLVDVDREQINMVAQVSPSIQFQKRSQSASHHKSSKKGEGLAGSVWDRREVRFWHEPDSADSDFVEINTSKAIQLKNACGIPLFYREEVIAVLEIGEDNTDILENKFTFLLDNIGAFLGPEIRRKQLELELQQIFMHARDIICVADLDGLIKKINPAACQLLGYSETEILATSFSEFIYPVDKEGSPLTLESLAKHHDVYYFENRCLTKGGRIIWISWTITPANDEQLLFCVGKDVTDKKELEGLLQKATDMARIGGWEIDVKTKRVFWSEMAKIIFEVSQDFKPNLQNTQKFYKQQDSRDAISSLISKSIENGVPWSLEAQIVTGKGRSYWIKVISESEFEDGKCNRVYGSFQDIDARKRLQVELEDSLKEKRTILESIGDAFFTLDKNWEVTYWNKMATKLTGVPSNLILARSIWEVFPDCRGGESYKQYHRSLAENVAIDFEEFYSPLQTWLQVSCYPSANGLTVYFKDITDRKNAEKQLRELADDLRRQTKELSISNAELEQFAYVASHDLQEPLRMITSFLSQLERKYFENLDDRAKQYIHFAVDGAKRMREIILDLLEFSRVGKSLDEIEEIDLNDLLDDIKKLYRRIIEESKAVISWDKLPALSTYKGPVRQVFQNLIGNGLKYVNKGQIPIVHISCFEKNEHWEFVVADNGIGIAPEYFEKIFVIFQRLHSKDEYSGTGMGLSITKKVVESLGGKIWVESDEGRGSKFYFTIPKVSL